jgi:hypothetical protein
MLRRLLWAGLAALVLGASILAAAPRAQLLNAAHLSVSVNRAEAVFDNGGNPWPFFTAEPAINYDQCGANCAYVATPHVNCPTNGSSYRADYINFNTDTVYPFRLGCFATSELYKYTINISQPGPYVVNLAMANGGGSSTTVSISIDNTVVATASVPTTGSYSTFATVTSGQFGAALGNHIITIACTAGNSDGYCGDFRSLQGAAASASGCLAGSTCPAGLWNIVERDEFNGSGLDPSGPWIEATGWVAGTCCYIDNTGDGTGMTPIYNGSTVKLRSFSNGAHGCMDACGGNGYIWRGTEGAGYYEIRLKSDGGNAGKVVWFLFGNQDCAGGGAFLNNGWESDIMESFGGSGSQINTHWGGYGSCHNSDPHDAGSQADNFHNFGVFWPDPAHNNGLTYIKDGVEIAHLNGPITNTGPIISSLCCGGINVVGNPGQPNGDVLEIDWVRYYHSQ